MHPPVPARDLSLDLNYDELLPLGDVTGVRAGGAERTTVFPLFEALAKQDNLTVQKGGADTGGGYFRSDHFSLARVGVPAFSVGEGGPFVGHDAEWSKRSRAATLVRTSTTRPPTSTATAWTSPATPTSPASALSWAGWSWPSRERVEWVPGDEFEAARKKSDARGSSSSFSFRKAFKPVILSLAKDLQGLRRLLLCEAFCHKASQPQFCKRTNVGALHGAQDDGSTTSYLRHRRPCDSHHRKRLLQHPISMENNIMAKYDKDRSTASRA